MADFIVMDSMKGRLKATNGSRNYVESVLKIYILKQTPVKQVLG